MAATIGVLDALTVALSLLTNREEEKDETCETTTVAWLAGAAALAARERRNHARLFSKTLSSPAVLFSGHLTSGSHT